MIKNGSDRTSLVNAECQALERRRQPPKFRDTNRKNFWGGMASVLLHELTRCNAELQAFAHTVAHDLREPLRTISAFTQILVRKARLDEADKEMARFIVDAVRRMSTLLEDLLSSATYGFKRFAAPRGTGACRGAGDAESEGGPHFERGHRNDRAAAHSARQRMRSGTAFPELDQQRGEVSK